MITRKTVTHFASGVLISGILALGVLTLLGELA